MDLIIRAEAFAREVHARQTRKGEAAEPYITHLEDVAALLAAAEAAVETIAAGWLHDTIEDGHEHGYPVTLHDLAERFGWPVAAIFGWYARRFETRLTVAEALLVELRRKREKMAGAFTEAQRALYLALLRGERHPEGRSESPFTPIDEPGDRIFDAYLKDLSLLPFELVEALVAFYDRERDIEAFLRQANERTFRGLRAERQAQMWEAFFATMPADYDALAARAEAMLTGYVAAVRRSPLRVIVRDRRPAGWDPSSR